MAETSPARLGSWSSLTPLPPWWHGMLLALWLSLAAALALGITRFAYGLLLPPMRADLGWTYALAGAMNTFNAIGYLIGALTATWLLRRYGAGPLLLAGALLASLFMASSGFFSASAPLLTQRLAAGVVSAWVFVAGGLLAARLGTGWPAHSGWLLGLYYGGVGWGIVLSALAVPPALSWADSAPHGWAWAWWALALVCLLATAALWLLVRSLRRLGLEVDAAPASAAQGGVASAATDWAALVQSFGWALAGYALFGLGYIGYMTFVIALLHEQGHAPAAITLFYTLLGLGVVASARLWAGWLERFRGGQALARLNALLGLATLVPALTAAWPALLASGLLFGAVFLSVVASTTALVRHNLPAAQWASGISAFTIVFAAGQIIGPTAVGWIADGPGGLERGLFYSALALWLGSALAWRQRALATSKL